MNIPFRSVNELLPEKLNDTAEPLKLFACAMYANGTFWGCREKVAAYLKMESHRDYYVETFVSYLGSMFDVYRLWRLKIVR